MAVDLSPGNIKTCARVTYIQTGLPNPCPTESPIQTFGVELMPFIVYTAVQKRPFIVHAAVQSGTVSGSLEVTSAKAATSVDCRGEKAAGLIGV